MGESSVSNWSRRLLAALALIAPVALVSGAGVALGFGLSRMIRIPRVEQLATFRPDIVTEVTAADGTVVARYAIEKRVLVDRTQIAPAMVKAILSAEDARFYSHGGIDAVRLGGALLHDISSRRLAQGASTITQQLARAVFLTPEKTFQRKLNEALLTVEIERRYSKDQILTMYLNQVNFGHGNYGVEAAARFYFGKPAAELTVPQAALLAGIVQRPAHHTPLRNPAAAKSRRDYVLRRMREEGYLDEDALRRYLASPIVVSRAARESSVGPYFCEEVRQVLEKGYGEKGLYRQGLRVRTTMDREIQGWATEALRSGLRAQDRKGGFRRPRSLVAEGIDPEAFEDASWPDLVFPAPPGTVVPAVVTAVRKSGAEVRIGERRLTVPAAAFGWTRLAPERAVKPGDLVHVGIAGEADHLTVTFEQEPLVEGAIVVIENGSGAVRALVGGYDFSRSKFDRATQALRQVGSAFKPFVYLTALEAGYTPADTVMDSPLSIVIDPRQPPYQPRNYYNKYSGIVTYQHALEQSINVPAVRVALMVGTRKVIETARRFGIRQNLLAYPSLALGSFEVSPMEMTAAYSVFASQGLYFPPRLVESVTDADGRVLEENHPEPVEAADGPAAYVALQMMRGVAQRGTAAAAAKLKLPVAGKTGTTNDYTDAWFVGCLPRYTIGVWVGHDTKKSLGSKQTGAEAALPIWMRLVEKMKAGGLVREDEDYTEPAGIVTVPVDLATGYRATPGCSRVILESFVAGTQPVDFCGERPHTVSTLPQYLQRALYTPKRGESVAEQIEMTDVPKVLPPLPEVQVSPSEGGPPG